MTDDTEPALDGKEIANRIFAHRNNPDALALYAGMACARLCQYQDALERAGIELPTHG